MNARTPWIVIIVIIIVLVGAWFAFGRTAEPAREMATATPQTTENETAPETMTVTYTDEGFSPFCGDRRFGRYGALHESVERRSMGRRR